LLYGLVDHADAMLGALEWEVNESNGYSGILNVPACARILN